MDQIAAEKLLAVLLRMATAEERQATALEALANAVWDDRLVVNTGETHGRRP